MSFGFNFFSLLIFCVLCFSCNQKEKSVDVAATKEVLVRDISQDFTPLDVSPPDIIYFPEDFPLQKMKGKSHGIPVARVIYGRPHKKGRSLFGSDPKSLCPYGKPWRLGANEGTELELFRSATVGGKTLPAGRYSLYCIPDSLTWTIAINGNIYNWGLDIDSSQDICRMKVSVEPTARELEDFTMYFKEMEGGMKLQIAWDNIKTSLPFTLP